MKIIIYLKDGMDGSVLSQISEAVEKITGQRAVLRTSDRPSLPLQGGTDALPNLRF